MSKKENVVRSPSCKFNPLARKSLKQPCLNRQLKSPKCYIKITGSRYNGTFLLNIDDGLDDAIFHTMRDIEVALEDQADPLGKPKVCPKNCLSSVFRCFGTSDLQTKTVCNRKKPQKSISKTAECSLTATINKSDIGPLINAVQANSFAASPETSSESVMRDVVDVFRTTLDQFRKENLNSFEVPSSQLLADSSMQLSPKQPPPINISKTEAIDRTNHLNEELKRVSFIKFSQEEVLVIQPPKPSNNETKELEVGIEVKPKTTASNVGQSIKLAKDKVLIGMQDGRGVLQINDGIPKRSLQMVIEEGVNGKPSMKLSLKEEEQDQNEQKIPEQNHNDGENFQKNKEEFPKSYINSKSNVNERSVCTIARSNGNTVKTGICYDKVKNFKSVESQVSWAHLKDIDIHLSDKSKFISESTQYRDSSSVQPSDANHCVCCSVGTKPKSTVENVANQYSDMPRPTILDSPYFKKGLGLQRDSHNNRMPYLVHTLYEPRSLNNSSAYFVSDKPSTHYGSIGKAPIPRKFEATKKQIRKPKSFSFSSDYSGSSKCTKIFRDIGEIRETGSKALGKKDASKRASLIEDFEKILQNMCGSSYLYHHPEPPESRASKEMEHQELILKSPQQGSGSMSFDQWTQTESSNKESRAGKPAAKGRVQKDKTPKIRESGDGSHRKFFKKKEKRTGSIASQKYAESSISASTSGLEDGLSSDSSESNKHKLVFSMFQASDDKPLASTSGRLMGENWINGKAKSVVGQRIFDAIDDHTNQPTLFGDIKKSDSFVYPACKESSRVPLQGGNNVSVAVNMALYDGPTGLSLTDITEEDPTEVKMMDDGGEGQKSLEFEEQWNHNSTLQGVTITSSSCPIRVKSKSCQNLHSSPSGSRSMENAEESGVTRTQIKKLRYPQLTATDGHHHTSSTLNVCGILNFNEGGIKTDDQSLVKFDHLNPSVDQALPSAIRSLLLPRQHSVIFNNHEQVPTYCCDRLITNNADGYWDSETINQHENFWGTTDEAFDSVRTVAIHRGIFKRTFFAMKSMRTVVTRKFSNIFQKLSFAHPDKKKKKNSAVNDSVVFVAIPLKKKTENLHLYPRLK